MYTLITVKGVDLVSVVKVAGFYSFLKPYIDLADQQGFKCFTIWTNDQGVDCFDPKGSTSFEDVHAFLKANPKTDLWDNVK